MILPDKDNEFDDLMREAGDNYHPTGATPDWENMQALLDKHMPVKEAPRRRGLYLLILLFLISGTAYLYFNSAREKAMVPVKTPQATLRTAGKTTGPAAVDPAGEEKKVGVDTKQQSTISAKIGEKFKENNSTPGTHLLSQYKTGRSRTITSQAEPEESNATAKTEDRTSPVEKNKVIQEAGNLTNGTTVQNVGPVREANDKPANKTMPPEIKNRDSKNTIANKKPDNKDIAAQNSKNKPAEQVKQNIEFSLLYAPELTTVNFYKIDKPGSNYGLLLGYHISKKLTIQTGYVKSTKNYIADGKDFKLDYPQSANHKLSKVDGYCDMSEIPLNLKAQISSGKKFNLFYTVGVSSYFMKREYYTYTYATTNGSYDKIEAYNSQKSYWFSLGTAGLGIEKEITNNLNIAAMPFIKIPFRGMGEGKMKLTGTGINFLLTYRP